ncbi:multicomponent Na+:H+ antiporter subunit G [Micromonospora phaseoli]|uniref:Multicomponent Na+:H+ antiporter subunit G n=1 Tax=Micromonospora phaseoli TaxID=1144548 RepID=A0A1H7D119_9ACTN|nr:monovalent cation/H(+) antiporter subunit G [Micromonospora phaseoli]PZV98102.1 multicomponent Na+:H+ antiporter subunit G [Micromonospora phaseoli]GIJ77787.1 Na+/H+ antiporter subunit G [Micromonospora phaseoli]SEJ95618.1 multicomponent Na+:H+ antiporter subunit G [Micromonospora phaseoli]
MIRIGAASLLLVLGTALIAIGAVGLIRLPDVYHRMNSVAKAASLGVSCVLLGVLLLIPGVRTAVVVLVAVGLQLFTAPIGGYALARAAYRSGAPLAAVTRYDELDGRVGEGRGQPGGREPG